MKYVGHRHYPDNAQSRLLTHVMQLRGAKNYVHLSRLLEIRSPAMSKLRHEKLYLSASLIIRIHEITGLSIREIKARAGQKCLTSYASAETASTGVLVVKTLL